jgi:glycosyltransferase involved in cell wall biosynthesis
MSATDPVRIAVVIPALNEERAIRAVVESVLAISPNVILIDDGSTDRTVECVADLPITLIRHATPLGKGQGLRDGFRKARALGFDAVIAMDGDGQHLAADIPRLLAAGQRYPEHIVIGARVRNRENQPPARRRANAVADWGISLACAMAVVDTQSGQRYYPLGALDLVDLAADDFVFEAALLIAAARDKNLGIVSVPIESRYQGEFRTSHFRPVRDVTRITLYTVGRILHYGHLVRSYRRVSSTPALVYDPSAEH